MDSFVCRSSAVAVHAVPEAATSWLGGERGEGVGGVGEENIAVHVLFGFYFLQFQYSLSLE